MSNSNESLQIFCAIMISMFERGNRRKYLIQFQLDEPFFTYEQSLTMHVQRLPTINIQCGGAFLRRLSSLCNNNPVSATVSNRKVSKIQRSSIHGDIGSVFISWLDVDYVVKIDDCFVIKFPVYQNEWCFLGSYSCSKCDSLSQRRIQRIIWQHTFSFNWT